LVRFQKYYNFPLYEMPKTGYNKKKDRRIQEIEKTNDDTSQVGETRI